MVIKSKKKFIRALLIILGISIGIIFIMTTKTSSHQDQKYKSISVLSGDTLWDIAKKEQRANPYYAGKDVRDIIEDIKEKNDLKSSALTVSQVLEIPTY